MKKVRFFYLAFSTKNIIYYIKVKLPNLDLKLGIKPKFLIWKERGGRGERD
jgi:hypothetical protein